MSRRPHHGAVQRLDAVDVIEVPQLRRVADSSPMSNRLVRWRHGQQIGPLREQAGEAICAGADMATNLSDARGASGRGMVDSQNSKFNLVANCVRYV